MHTKQTPEHAQPTAIYGAWHRFVASGKEGREEAVGEGGNETPRHSQLSALQHMEWENSWAVQTQYFKVRLDLSIPSLSLSLGPISLSYSLCLSLFSCLLIKFLCISLSTI